MCVATKYKRFGKYFNFFIFRKCKGHKQINAVHRSAGINIISLNIK